MERQEENLQSVVMETTEGIFQGQWLAEADRAMSLTFSQGSSHLILPTDW